MPEELFTKKPITVPMMLWTGENEAELQAWCGDTTFGACRGDTPDDHDPQITAHVYDRLHDTWVGLRTGDRVARGVKGEFYPIAPEVVAETYGPARAGMLTVSGVCTCSRCERGGREIYRMVGSCWNCKTSPVLMLFRAGERADVLDCPRCKVKAVHAERLATDDEIPAAEPPAPCVSCGREPGTYENYRGQLLCAGCADGTSPEGAAAVAESVKTVDAEPALTDRLTPEQWCARYGLDILDPDGWRDRDAPPWDAPLPLPEFWTRYAQCTARGITTGSYARIVADVKAARAAGAVDADA